MKFLHVLIPKVLCIIAFIAGAGVTVHAQSTNLPAGFPKIVSTGNAEKDALAYDQAKRQWIEANPEAYQQLTGAAQRKHIISKSEFATMPQEKQQHILSNPGMYSIEEVSATRQDVQEVYTPAPVGSAPVKTKVTAKMLSTVSPEKAAFIKANPTLYEITD